MIAQNISGCFADDSSKLANFLMGRLLQYEYLDVISKRSRMISQKVDWSLETWAELSTQ